MAQVMASLNRFIDKVLDIIELLLGKGIQNG